MSPHELAQYIEEVAVHMEQHGLPRIAGRIMGLLMVCDPPYRSQRQLVAEIGASKGSVSTMLRLLLAAGTLEVVAVPGDRATHYRLVRDSFQKRFEQKISAMTGFWSLAERGLALMPDAPPERTAYLRELAAMCAFLERELPPAAVRAMEGRARWLTFSSSPAQPTVTFALWVERVPL